MTLGGDLDFWPTPPAAVDAVVPHIPMCGTTDGLWDVVDAGCGDGAIGSRLLKTGFPMHSLTGFEVHQDRAFECSRAWGAKGTVHHEDFLRLSYADLLEIIEPKKPVLVIMNPPYTKPFRSIGYDFVCQALCVADVSAGAVVALLPLSFAEGAARSKLHKNRKSSLCVFSSRPRFGGEYGTGSKPYAWFVWDTAYPKNEWRVI